MQEASANTGRSFLQSTRRRIATSSASPIWCFIGFAAQVGRAVGLCFGVGRELDLAVPAAVVLDLLLVVWLLVEIDDLAMPAGLAIMLDCVVVVRAGAWAVRVAVVEIVTEV